MKELKKTKHGIKHPNLKTKMIIAAEILRSHTAQRRTARSTEWHDGFECEQQVYKSKAYPRKVSILVISD
ncbi:hypothetical protein PM082_004380 [Marasmius tenuissimus]|nr:hypothetical protein PM082_004380 [Marasmius tenuissimus]